MIFRRIKAHMEKENWFAVGVDFVIVVIGVFIGIQVANWNDARTEAEQERQALAAILDDLKADRVMLDNTLAIAQRNIDGSNYLLIKSGFPPLTELILPASNQTILGDSVINIDPPAPIPDRAKSMLWGWVTLHYYPEQRDAAIDALTAAGNLGLVKDAGLVRDLQNHRLLWKALESSNNLTYRPLRERLLFVGQEAGLTPFSKIDEALLVQRLGEHTTLRSAMRTLLEFTVLHRRQISQLGGESSKLIERIEGVLETLD